MTFEMHTTSTEQKPKTDDIRVRFLYSNGTASDSSLKQFPVFGKDSQSWSDFQTGMSKFAISNTDEWCKPCGGNTGQCAERSTSGDSKNASTSSQHGNGIPKAVAGVIGALVTLAVILGLETLVIVFCNIRLIKKRKVQPVVEGSGKQ